MDPEQIDEFVMVYLKKKGFSTAAKDLEDHLHQNKGSETHNNGGSFGSIDCHNDPELTKLIRSFSHLAPRLGWNFLDPITGISSPHSSICESVSSPLMAESVACRAALMDALKKGVTHINLASDCQQLVRAIKTRTTSIETHGIIMADVFISISSFSNFLCRHTPRTDNVVAHGLAKQALALYVPIV